MIGEKILEWTKKQLNKGKSKAEIVKELKNGGYSEREAEKIVKKEKEAETKKVGKKEEEEEKQKEKTEKKEQETKTEEKEEESDEGKKKIIIIVVVLVVLIMLVTGIVAVAGLASYFWIGGLTAAPSSTKAPRTISVGINCATSGGVTEVEISHNSPSERESIKSGDLHVSGAGEGFKEACPNTELPPGGTTNCKIDGFGSGDGTVTIYGDAVAQAQTSC